MILSLLFNRMTLIGKYDNKIMKIVQQLQQPHGRQTESLINEAFELYNSHVSELSIKSRQTILSLIINRLYDIMTPTLVNYLEIIINTEYELVIGSNNTLLFNQQTLYLLIILAKEKLICTNTEDDSQTLDQLLLIVHRYVHKCAEYLVFCSQHSLKEALTGKITQSSLKFLISLLESLQYIDQDIGFDVLCIAIQNINKDNVLQVITIITVLLKRTSSLMFKILTENVTFNQISQICFTTEDNDNILQLINLMREISNILKMQTKYQLPACKFIYEILKPLEMQGENQCSNNIDQKIELINIVHNMLNIIQTIQDNGEQNIWQYKIICLIMNFHFCWMQNEIRVSIEKLHDDDQYDQVQFLEQKCSSFTQFCNLFSAILNNYQIQTEEIKEQLQDNLYVSNILLGIRSVQDFYQQYMKCFCQMYMSIDMNVSFDKQVFIYIIIKQFHNSIIDIIVKHLKISEDIFQILVFKFQLFSNLASIIPESLLIILNNYEIDIAIQQCVYKSKQEKLTQKDANEEMFLCYIDLMERDHLLRQFYKPIIQSIYHVSPTVYYDTVASYLLQLVIHKLDTLDGTSVLYQENPAYQYKYNPYLLNQYDGIVRLQKIPAPSLNQLLVEFMAFTPEFVYPRGLSKLSGIHNCLSIALSVFFFIQRSGVLKSRLVNEFIIKTTVILNKYGQTDIQFERTKLFSSLQALIIFMENEYYIADTSILETNGILPKEINLQMLNTINSSIDMYKQQTQESQPKSLISIIKKEFKCASADPRVHFMSLLFVICYYPLSAQGMRQFLQSVLRLFCIGLNRNCLFSRSFIAQIWAGKCSLPDAIGLKLNDFSFLLRDSKLFLENVTQLEIQQLIRSCNGAVQQYNICFNDIFAFHEKLKYNTIHEKSNRIPAPQQGNQSQHIKQENANENNIQHGDILNQNMQHSATFDNHQDGNLSGKTNQSHDKHETYFQLYSCDVPMRVILTRMLLMPDPGDADIYNNFIQLCIAPTNLQYCGPNYIHAKSILRGKRYAVQLQADVMNFQHPYSLKITAECCLNIISLYQHLVDNQVNCGIQGFDFYCRNNLWLDNANTDVKSNCLTFQQIMMRDDEKINISYNSILYYAIIWLQEQQVYTSCYDIFNKDTYDKKNVSKLYKIVESCWSIIHKQYQNNKSSSGISLTLLVACTLLIQNLVESYSTLQFYIVNNVNIPGGQEFINDVLQVVLKLLTNKKVNGVIQTQTIQSYLLKTLINITQTKTNQNKFQLYVKPILLSVINKPFDYIIQYKLLDFIKQLIIEYEKGSSENANIEQQQKQDNQMSKIQITEQEYKDLFTALAVTLQIIHDPSSQYHLTELAKHQIQVQINIVLNLLFLKSEDQIAFNKMLLNVCSEISADRVNYVLYDYAVMTTKYLYGLDGFYMIQDLIKSQINRFGGSGEEKSELLVIKSSLFNNFNIKELTAKYKDIISSDTSTGLIISCYLSQQLQNEIQFDKHTRNLINKLISHLDSQVHNEFRKKYLKGFNILSESHNNQIKNMYYETLFGQFCGSEFVTIVHYHLQLTIQCLIQNQNQYLTFLEELCFCGSVCGLKLEAIDNVTQLVQILQQYINQGLSGASFWLLQLLKQQQSHLTNNIYENDISLIQNSLNNNLISLQQLFGFKQCSDVNIDYENIFNLMKNTNSINITPIIQQLDQLYDYQVANKIIRSSFTTEVIFIMLIYINEKFANSYEQYMPSLAKVFNTLVDKIIGQSDKQNTQCIDPILVYADLLFASNLSIDIFQNINTTTESDNQIDAQSDKSDINSSADETQFQADNQVENVSAEGIFYLPQQPNIHLPSIQYTPQTWGRIQQLSAQDDRFKAFESVRRALNLKQLAKLQAEISVLLNDFHVNICAQSNPEGLELSLRAFQASSQGQQLQQNVSGNQASASSQTQQTQQEQNSQQTLNDKMMWSSDDVATATLLQNLIKSYKIFTHIVFELFDDIARRYLVDQKVVEEFFSVRNERFADFESAIRASGFSNYAVQSGNPEKTRELRRELNQLIAEISFWATRISLLAQFQPVILVEIVNNGINDNILINQYVSTSLRYYEAVGQLLFLAVARPNAQEVENGCVLLPFTDRDPFHIIRTLIHRMRPVYDINYARIMSGTGSVMGANQGYNQGNPPFHNNIPGQNVGSTNGGFPNSGPTTSGTSISTSLISVLELLESFYASYGTSPSNEFQVFDVQRGTFIPVALWTRRLPVRDSELILIADAIRRVPSTPISLSAWLYAAWIRILTAITSPAATVSLDRERLGTIQRLCTHLNNIYASSYSRHVYSNAFVRSPATTILVESSIFALIRIFFQGAQHLKQSIQAQQLQMLSGPFYNDEVLQSIIIDLGIRTTLKSVTDFHINLFQQQKKQQQQQNNENISQKDIDSVIQQFREENNYIGIYQDNDVNQNHSSQNSKTNQQKVGQTPLTQMEFWPLRLHQHMHYNEIIHLTPEYLYGSQSSNYPYIQLCVMRCLRISKRFNEYRNTIGTLDSICGMSSEFSAQIYSMIQQTTINVHNMQQLSYQQVNQCQTSVFQQNSNNISENIQISSVSQEKMQQKEQNLASNSSFAAQASKSSTKAKQQMQQEEQSVANARKIRAQVLQQKLFSVAVGCPDLENANERNSLTSLIINILATAPILHPLDLQSTLWLFKLQNLDATDFIRSLAARGYHQIEKGSENGPRAQVKTFDFLHHKSAVHPNPYDTRIKNNHGFQILLQRLYNLGHASLPVQVGTMTSQSILDAYAYNSDKNSNNNKAIHKPLKSTQITALKNLKQYYHKNLNSDREQLESVFSEPFYADFMHYLNTSDADLQTQRLTHSPHDTASIITQEQMDNGIGAQMCLQGVMMALYFLSKVRAQIDKLDPGSQTPQIRQIYIQFKQEGAKIGSEFEECSSKQKEWRRRQNHLKANKQDVEQRLSEFSLQAAANPQSSSLREEQSSNGRDHEPTHAKEQMINKITEINTKLHTITLQLMQTQKDIFSYYKRYFKNIYDFCTNILQNQDRRTHLYTMCQNYLHLNDIIVQLFQVDKVDIDTILTQNSLSCVQHQILIEYLQQNNENELIMAYKIPYQICYLSDNQPYVITSNSKILYPVYDSECQLQEYNIYPSSYLCKNSQIKLGENNQYKQNYLCFKHINTYKNTVLNFDILHFVSEFFRYSIGYTNRDVNIQFLCIQNNYTDAINKITSKPVLTLDIQKFKSRAHEQIYTGITQYVMNILRENIGENNHKWFNPQLIPSSFIYNFTTQDGSSGLNPLSFINCYCEILKIQQQQRHYALDQYLYESILQLDDYQLLEQLIQQSASVNSVITEDIGIKINLINENSQQQQSQFFNNNQSQFNQHNFNSQNQNHNPRMNNPSENMEAIQRQNVYKQVALNFQSLFDQLRKNQISDNQPFDGILSRITYNIKSNLQRMQQAIVYKQLSYGQQLPPIQNSIQHELPRNNNNIYGNNYSIQQVHQIQQSNNALYHQQQQQQIQQQQQQQIIKQMQQQSQTQNITDFRQIIEQMLNSTVPGYNQHLFNIFIDKSAHFYNIISKVLDHDDNNHNVLKMLYNLNYKPPKLDFEESFRIDKYRSMMECYSALSVTLPTAFIQGVTFCGGIKRQLGKQCLQISDENDLSWIPGGEMGTFLPLFQLLQLSQRPNTLAPGIYNFLMHGNTTQQIRYVHGIYQNIFTQIREIQQKMQKERENESGASQNYREEDQQNLQTQQQGNYTNSGGGYQMPPVEKINYIYDMLQSDSELFYQDPETLLFMLITSYSKFQENYQLIQKITMIFGYLLAKCAGQDPSTYKKYIVLYQEIIMLLQYSDNIYHTYTRLQNVQKIVEYINDYQQRCFDLQQLETISNTQLNYICTIRLLILQVANNVIIGSTENLMSEEQKADLQFIKEKTLCMRLDTITAVSYLLRSKKYQVVTAYNIAKGIISYNIAENILLDSNISHIMSIIAYYRCQIINLERINVNDVIQMINSCKEVIANAVQHYKSISVSTDNIYMVKIHQIIQLLNSSSVEFEFIKGIIELNQFYIKYGEYNSKQTVFLQQQYKILQESQIQDQHYCQHTFSLALIIEHVLKTQIEQLQRSPLSQQYKEQLITNVNNLIESYLNCLEEINQDYLYDIKLQKSMLSNVQVLALQKWIQFLILPDPIHSQSFNIIAQQKSQSNHEQNSSGKQSDFIDSIINNHQNAIDSFGRLQIIQSAELLIKQLAYSQKTSVMQQSVCTFLLLKLLISENKLQKVQDNFINKELFVNQIETILSQYNQNILNLTTSEQQNDINNIITQILPNQQETTIKAIGELFQNSQNTYQQIKTQIVHIQNILSPNECYENLGKIFLAFTLKCINNAGKSRCNLKDYLEQINVPAVVWIYKILHKINISQQAITKFNAIIQEVRQYYLSNTENTNLTFPDFESIYKYTCDLLDKLTTNQVAETLSTKLLKLYDLKSLYADQELKNYTGFIGTEHDLHENIKLIDVHECQGEYVIKNTTNHQKVNYVMHTKRHCYYQLASTTLKVHMVDEFPMLQINFYNIQNETDRVTLLLVQKPDLTQFASFPNLNQLLQKINFDDIYQYNKVYHKFSQLTSENRSGALFGGEATSINDYRHEMIGRNYVQIFGYSGSNNVNQRFKQLQFISAHDFQDLGAFKVFKEKLSRNVATFMLFNQLFWSGKRQKQIQIGQKTVDLDEGRIVCCTKLSVSFVPAMSWLQPGEMEADGAFMSADSTEETAVVLYMGQTVSLRRHLAGPARLYQGAVLQSCLQQLHAGTGPEPREEPQTGGSFQGHGNGIPLQIPTIPTLPMISVPMNIPQLNAPTPKKPINQMQGSFLDQQVPGTNIDQMQMGEAEAMSGIAMMGVSGGPVSQQLGYAPGGGSGQVLSSGGAPGHQVGQQVPVPVSGSQGIPAEVPGQSGIQGPIPGRLSRTPQHPSRRNDGASVLPPLPAASQAASPVAVSLGTSFLRLLTPEFVIGHVSSQICKQLKQINQKLCQGLFSDTVQPVHVRFPMGTVLMNQLTAQLRDGLSALSAWLVPVLHEVLLSSESPGGFGSAQGTTSGASSGASGTGTTAFPSDVEATAQLMAQLLSPLVPPPEEAPATLTPIPDNERLNPAIEFVLSAISDSFQ